MKLMIQWSFYISAENLTKIKVEQSKVIKSGENQSFHLHYYCTPFSCTLFRDSFIVWFLLLLCQLISALIF